MPGKVLNIEEILDTDVLGCALANKYIEWDLYKYQKKLDWEEVRRYVYATDTSKTTNSQLPWKNKTTIPKLCQIADNLLANYLVNTFPQREWLFWEANSKDSNSLNKREAIVDYMGWAITQPSFKHEMKKTLMDYIHYGNCFAMPEWLDQRITTDDNQKVGYLGPTIRRISPLDIVFNPTAESFERTPKIIRSIISMGELKEILQRESTDQNREEYEKLWNYLREIRVTVRTFPGDVQQQDNMYSVDGFHSFREYLGSDTVELLTFYGDIYDADNDDFLKNHIITVVDRHKVITKKPIESSFGYPPIFHVAWRERQDNLWGMGPLDNLVGMQYRMDHVENMKADIFDLTTFPVLINKGPGIEDYRWGPGEQIFMDTDSSVEMLVPDVQALQANFEIQNLERLMEEMAGAPREALGIRSPGEKTKYEVQRLENASGRMFQHKGTQFEEQFVEPLLNAMLEQARRNLSSAVQINIFDDEFRMSTFRELTVNDITGIGRIRPIGARHFAEQAELVQNLTNLSGSPLWQSVAPHFSTIGLAKVFEEIFNLKDYEIVKPNIALSEQAEAQRQMQALEEQVMTESQTATGIGEDFDIDQGPPVDTPQPIPSEGQGP